MRSLLKSVGWLAIGMAGLLAFSLPAGADDDDARAGGRVPLPSIAEGYGEHCVQPEEEMRRNHMNYILHQRDETVHEGIRTPRYSIEECINCHVKPGPDGQPVSIQSRDHFCNSCHAYAAVSIDCFECHTTQPSGPPLHLSGKHAGPRDFAQFDSGQPLRDMLKAHMLESNGQ